MVCKNSTQRKSLLKTLKDNDILAVFHYLVYIKASFIKTNMTGDKSLSAIIIPTIW